MALDLPLPERVFGHPWFISGTDKMSKSRGNVIYADELAQRFGVDGVRYYALSEMPYVNDGSITYENVINRYNTDLANNLGNLVSRTVAMTKKYFDGVIPAPAGEEGTDAELKETALAAIKAFDEKMDTFHIAEAIDEVVQMLRRTNKYIDEPAPWALARTRLKKHVSVPLCIICWNASAWRLSCWSPLCPPLAKRYSSRSARIRRIMLPFPLSAA